jgi:hypothetical protein
VDQAKRLKGLEQENFRPKRIVADQVLDLSILQEVYFRWTSGRRRPSRSRPTSQRARVETAPPFGRRTRVVPGFRMSACPAELSSV